MIVPDLKAGIVGAGRAVADFECPECESTRAESLIVTVTYLEANGHDASILVPDARGYFNFWRCKGCGVDGPITPDQLKP